MQKILCALLLAAAPLSAQVYYDFLRFYETDNCCRPIFPFDCAISGGWRRDAITSTEKALGSDHSSLWSDQLDASGMDVWQFGIKYRITLAGLTFYDHNFFLDNFYIRGSLYGGTINNGHFKEGPFSHFVSSSDVSFPSSSSCSSSSSSPSSWSSSSWSSSLKSQWIRHGNTLNGDIVIGFNYPVGCWFNFAPVAGYSVDNLKIRLRDDNIRENYTTKWRGPFVGIDLASEVRCFRFRGGYEYHWGEWRGSLEIRAKKKVHHPHFPHYRDRRNGNCVKGHVGWLDLRFAWTVQLDLGIGLKYQYFRLPRGRFTERDHHPLSSEAIVLRNVGWRSFGVMGELVWRF